MSESQYERELFLVLMPTFLWPPQSWENTLLEESSPSSLSQSTGHYSRPGADLRPACEELTQLQITGVPAVERRTSQTVQVARRAV